MTFWLGMLGVALAGGIHCLGMCGGLAAMANSPLQWASYQVGRLISYLTLGGLTYEFGTFLFRQETGPVVKLGLLVLIGVWFWALQKAPRWASRQRLGSFLMGFFTGFLPCHFLWFFAAVAATQATLIMALMTMIALWTGSLPWLGVASSLRHLSRPRFFQSLQRFRPVLMGLIVIWATWNVVGKNAHWHDGPITSGSLICNGKN